MDDSSSPPQNPNYHSASLPPHPPISAPRRLPPPCWSHEETVALIDSYREKWYSLRRGNLRASHWQEVADAVSNRCPLPSSSPKTSVQCRHKMEKLRKRYRTELQRSRGTGSSSSWVLFRKMHSMEKGSGSCHSPSDESDEDEEEEEDDDDLFDNTARTTFNHGNVNNGVALGAKFNRQSPIRIRIPGGSSRVPPKSLSLAQENPNSHPKVKREREGDAVAEMVGAIRVLGDGFVKMEQMKMEMAREIEAMRMEMEIKRTEMVLESQQRIVEAIANGFVDKRRKQRGWVGISLCSRSDF